MLCCAAAVLASSEPSLAKLLKKKLSGVLVIMIPCDRHSAIYHLLCFVRFLAEHEQQGLKIVLLVFFVSNGGAKIGGARASSTSNHFCCNTTTIVLHLLLLLTRLILYFVVRTTLKKNKKIKKVV